MKYVNLKRIRKEKGLTQRELADLIGKDRSLIAKIESEDVFPSVSTAKAIARVLNFDWTVFFRNVGEKTSHKKEM